MRMTYLAIVLSVALGGMGSAHADLKNLQKAKQTFKEAWDDDYFPSECGDNIKRFVNRLNAKKIDLKGAQVLIFKPRVDGELINVERSRFERNVTLEANWYFHVVLLLEGHVFDFDYLNRPTPTAPREYLDQMFFNEISPPFYPHDRYSRKWKEDYKVETHSAEAFIAPEFSWIPDSEVLLSAFEKQI